MIYLAKADYHPTARQLRRVANAQQRKPSIQQRIDHGTTGYISASREHLSSEENAARTRHLYTALRKRGYNPTPAEGRYGSVPERSFMIEENNHRHLHDTLRDMSERYGQESFIIRHNHQHKMVFPHGSADHPFPHHLIGHKLTHETPTTEDRTRLDTGPGTAHTVRMEDFEHSTVYRGLGRSMRRTHRVHAITLHTPEGPHHLTMHFDPEPHDNSEL